VRCGEYLSKGIHKHFFLSHVTRLLSRPHGGTNLPHLSVKHNEDPGLVKGVGGNIFAIDRVGLKATIPGHIPVHTGSVRSIGGEWVDRVPLSPPDLIFPSKINPW
jgi:hypothetical protein